MIPAQASARQLKLGLQTAPEDRSKPASIRAYNDFGIRLAERLGSKLFHLHVHHIDREAWVKHKPLLYGFVDDPRLFAALARVPFRGALILKIARNQFRRWPA